jgi:hypothetical protein
VHHNELDTLDVSAVVKEFIDKKNNRRATFGRLIEEM